MEFEDTPSRVSIGFPLGLAFLFGLFLFICGFFCFCLHWNKLQSFFQSSSGVTISPHQQAQMQADFTSSFQKPASPVVTMKQNYAESLPVLMPGDEIPRFIAMACPCQPPMDERITIEVHKSSTQ